MLRKFDHRLIWLSLALIFAGCASSEKSSTPAVQTGLASPLAAENPASAATSLSPVSSSPHPDPFLEQRLAMVANTIESRGVANPDVLRVMRDVPRHEFVPLEHLDRAYGDHPLPIGYGQTISQPYIAAWMTELIELEPGEKVLEIGTGSGYQAAILAELGYGDVYSIEIVPELAASVKDRLERLGYSQVHVRQGDGYYGWPGDMLFDAIIVTAAPDHLPAPLAAQLADGGRLVVPIGPAGSFQTLWKFVKEQGELTAYNLGSVAFVPLISEGSQDAPLPFAP